MKIVIDTNILMSALIKDSITRKMIINPEFEFYYPKVSLEELNNHGRLILSKSKLDKQEYKNLLKKLLDNVVLVPTEHFYNNLDEAIKIMKDVDINDVPFLACAISLNAEIWSDDSDFRKQKKVKIFTTAEFIKKFLKSS
ncbi:MAG: PIN domain-containing protein [archaeon]